MLWTSFYAGILRKETGPRESGNAAGYIRAITYLFFKSDISFSSVPYFDSLLQGRHVLHPGLPQFIPPPVHASPYFVALWVRHLMYERTLRRVLVWCQVIIADEFLAVAEAVFFTYRIYHQLFAGIYML